MINDLSYYEKIFDVLDLSQILLDCQVSEAEVLDILIRHGYLELPDYVRRLSLEGQTEETEETEDEATISIRESS